MNFDEAIQTHAEWKQKLGAYLKNPDRSLDPVKVGRDDGCALGRWIHQGGGALSTTAEFPQLKAAHASFHLAAAEVVARADRGESIAADLILGGASPYAQAAVKVTQLLLQLRRRL